MAYFGIAVASTTNEVATLRVLRAYASDALGELRAKLGSDEPALVFSTSEHAIQVGLEESVRLQHRRFIEACERLEGAGAVTKLWYWVMPHSTREAINPQMARNLFRSELRDLRQEHD